jgi:hypothetical protein
MDTNTLHRFNTTEYFHPAGSYYREDAVNGGWEYVVNGEVIGDAISDATVIAYVCGWIAAGQPS